MKKIGLTGMIGSGKSFVGNYLTSKNFFVLDTDREVHQLYKDSVPLRSRIAEIFGSEALSETGISRTFLIPIVFNDKEARKKLETLVYPSLEEKILNFFEEHRKKTVFVEAALFFKIPKILDMLDEIWLIECEESLRQRRLQNRGLSEEDAKNRIQVQKQFPELHHKNIIRIQNDSSVQELEAKIEVLLRNME